MFRRSGLWLVTALLLLSFPPKRAHTDQAMPSPFLESAVDRLEARLNTIDATRTWRDYLQLQELRRQLSLGDRADVEVVQRIAGRFATSQTLPAESYVNPVQAGLQTWLANLQQLNEDLLRVQAAARPDMSAIESESAVDNRAKLQQIRQGLDQFLRRFGSEEQAWRRFLRWDELVQQADGPAAPNTETLRQLAWRYRAAAPLIGDATFGKAADALDSVARLEACTHVAEDDVRQQLEGLGQYLAALQDSDDSVDRAAVARALDWLEQRRQSPSLVTAARAQLCRPNVHIYLPRDSLQPTAPPTQESQPFRDVILGTTYRGTALTTGQSSVSLLPGSNQIAADMGYQGRIATTSVGRNGPVAVRSVATTRFSALKKVVWTELGAVAEPTRAAARTTSTIRGIDYGRVLGRQTAVSRVHGNKARTDREVQQRTETRVRTEMDSRVGRMVRSATDTWLRRWRMPIVQRGLVTGPMQISSTPAAAHVAFAEASARQLAANSGPPPTPATKQPSLRMHQSFLDNFVEGMAEERAWTETALASRFSEYLGFVPAGLSNIDPAREWSITLEKESPLQLRVDDRRAVLHVRAKEFSVGDTRYPGMWITATYEFTPADGAFTGQLAAPVELRPPDSVPGQRLGVRQQVFRSMLRKRLARLFPERLERDGAIRLPNDFPGRKAWRISLRHCDNGWLTFLLEPELHHAAQFSANVR